MKTLFGMAIVLIAFAYALSLNDSDHTCPPAECRLEHKPVLEFKDGELVANEDGTVSKVEVPDHVHELFPPSVQEEYLELDLSYDKTGGVVK